MLVLFEGGRGVRITARVGECLRMEVEVGRVV